MTRLKPSLFVLLLMTLWVPSVRAETNDPDRVRVWLKAGGVVEASRQATRTPNAIRLRLPEAAGWVEYVFDDIAGIAFPVTATMERARTLFREGQVEESARIATDTLMPLLRFLPVKNNIHDEVTFMLEAQFHAGRYADVASTAAELRRVWSDEKDLALVHIYSVLSRAQQTGNLDILEELMTLQNPGRQSEAFAPYWYGRSLYLQYRGQWMNALESVVRIPTLQAQNHVWMPRALYQTAWLYWKMRNETAADSIVAQMNMLYTDDPFTAQANALKEAFPFPQLKDPSFEEEEGSTAWTVDPSGGMAWALRQDGTLHDNGFFPDGTQAIAVVVSPLRPPVSIRQVVQGFQPGVTYSITGYQSARAAQGADTAGPFLEIRLDDAVVLERHLVRPVQGRGRFGRPFHRFASEPFTATSAHHVVSFVFTPGPGDVDLPRTALLDHLAIHDLSLD